MTSGSTPSIRASRWRGRACCYDAGRMRPMRRLVRCMPFGLALDRTRRVLVFQQRELMLSPREADVLAVLLRHTGRVVERSAFAAAGGPVSASAVDVTVARLRQKLAAVGAQHVRVEPVRGRGYCLRMRMLPPVASGGEALRRRG